ncbi:hypothetical protein MRX96_049244 [Rhipicephalus microplus]
MRRCVWPGATVAASKFSACRKPKNSHSPLKFDVQQLALENEKLRCQIKEERREFHKIISSLETKLEARLNALEANNNATHAISRATVAHSLEGGTAKVDIPQRFSEEAHVSQLQMGEQLQSLRKLNARTPITTATSSV